MPPDPIRARFARPHAREMFASYDVPYRWAFPVYATARMSL